jgi:hypothetical protein
VVLFLRENASTTPWKTGFDDSEVSFRALHLDCIGINASKVSVDEMDIT